MKKIRFSLVLSLVMVLLLSCFGGCADHVDTVSPTPTTSAANSLENSGIHYAASYAELYSKLEEAMGGSYLTGKDERAKSSQSSAEFSQFSAELGSTTDAPSMEAYSGSDGYSATNIQVTGIDEGDIVKTDGKHIYILRDNQLVIAVPDGAKTKVLSKTAMFETNVVNRDENVRWHFASERPSEMYLYGNYAAVITYYSSSLGNNREDGTYYYEDASVTKLYIYDVSDPNAPTLAYQLGQDGDVLTSRLLDGTLYLLSSYNVYNPNEYNEESFVPSLYRNGEKELISCDSIAVMPGNLNASYTVLSAYDLAAGTMTANQSVLGGGGIVYMNQNSLYLAASSNDTTESEPYLSGVYTSKDYRFESSTKLTRFDLYNGGITLAAAGSVSGILSDQFAMDEYNGHLRLVTTVTKNRWSIYTDENNFITQKGDEFSRTNSLYVLDSSLSTIGSIEGLAENEQVYSVRFSGDIGYFVTFRQTDPLFAVDLSDPANPKVLSALKIPGFSEYLHVFSEGRLFGLGVDADENGSRMGMKLSMFDTSNAVDVTEKHTLKLNTNYSIALSNHKAILISTEKNIIAFPADNGYDVYGYSDETGFFKRAHIAAESWDSNARGLYIGNMVYIITMRGITVLDMSSFEKVLYTAY